VIIRQHQMDALGAAVLSGFENEMVAHLANFSPALSQTIQESQMREAIRFGIARAQEYGITFRGPVRLYLELMMLFGSHFDTDPQYPWASGILRSESPIPQMERAQLMYERTRDYRAKVAGCDDVNRIDALKRMSRFSAEALPLSSGDLTAMLIEGMARIYPQKTAYIGREGMEALIDEGVGAAHDYGFATPRATALAVALMFALGHGCFQDPLYPWIEEMVKDEAVRGPGAKADALERKALKWLHQLLAHADSDARV
jgi:hypothetical protein